jgi:hypothetical protein
MDAETQGGLRKPVGLVKKGDRMSLRKGSSTREKTCPNEEENHGSDFAKATTDR